MNQARPMSHTPLSQLAGNAATMQALSAAFAEYPSGMDVETFAHTMTQFFPQEFYTPPSATSAIDGEETGMERCTVGADSQTNGMQKRVKAAGRSVRQRRILARLEVARVVDTNPLRLLFDRMDTGNKFAVTWSDFLEYVVDEATSAGVFSMVKDEFRAYSHARTRHGQPLPDLSPSGDVRGTLLQRNGQGAGGSMCRPAPSPAEAPFFARHAETRKARMAQKKEEKQRREVMRTVWRGHLNKYGGKLVASGNEKEGPAKGTNETASSTQAHEPKDIAQIEFLDALPTNPIAFAVCCRHRPLTLYHKYTFDLIKTFSEADLGNAQPTLVTYVASSDTLLVYSATDSCIRGFCGLFTTPHMSTTNTFKVNAGALRSWRQCPQAFPEMLFVAGSYGFVQQLRIPRRHRDTDVKEGTLPEMKLSDDGASADRGKLMEMEKRGNRARELRVVRTFDVLHPREAGGIIDFVMNETHFFSCGFDHRIMCFTLATGTRIVIGQPSEAIRSLGYNAAMHAILAVTLCSNELYLWDAKAVTTVPGTRFTTGDGEGGGSTSADSTARIIGIECPEDMPHVVTADDAGMVKVWDLRSRMCVQRIRADGVRNDADGEDPDVVYGNRNKATLSHEDEVKFSRAVQLRAQSGRANRLDVIASQAQPGFDTSTSVTTRSGTSNVGASPSSVSGVSQVAVARGAVGDASATSLAQRTSTAAAAMRNRSGPSVLVSLAYFGASHEIVTCTTDTIYTLRHNQREDPAVCDIDFVLGSAHAIREGTAATGDVERANYGSFLLQGPSRLTLWDVAGGFRTRAVDRALNPAVPLLRREVAALCLDDLGNRVFLSFPDGSLEVHPLRAVFDVNNFTPSTDGNGGCSSASPVRRSGCVIIAPTHASPSDNATTAGGTPEVVTELAYITDQKLLAGVTDKGRLLLRSEDEVNPFFTFACPSGTSAPLLHLTVSGELGSVCVTSTVPNGGSQSPMKSEEAVSVPASAAASPVNSPSPMSLGVPSPSTPEARPGLPVMPCNKRYGLYLYDYRHAGVVLPPPVVTCLSRPVERVTFLEALPVLLTVHDKGDIVLWSTPPIRGGVFPIIGMNVFTTGALSQPVPHETIGLKRTASNIYYSEKQKKRKARPVTEVPSVDAVASRPGSKGVGNRNAGSPRQRPMRVPLLPSVSASTRPQSRTRGHSTGASVISSASLVPPTAQKAGSSGSNTSPDDLAASFLLSSPTPHRSLPSPNTGDLFPVSRRASLGSVLSEASPTKGWETTVPFSRRELHKIGPSASFRHSKRETEEAAVATINGRTPAEEEAHFASLAREQHVTCVTFDPRSHRLYFGDSKGVVHAYSLCPTIQAYGLQTCRLEGRRSYFLHSNVMNVTPRALPVLVSCEVVHGNAAMGTGRKAEQDGGAAVMSLNWFPFVGVLLSSGEDHRVAVLDGNAKPIGALSAARLPTLHVDADTPTRSSSVGASNNSGTAAGADAASREIPPYNLPPHPRLDVQRELHQENGPGLPVSSPQNAEEPLDACSESCCRRYFDDPSTTSEVPSRPSSACPHPPSFAVASHLGRRLPNSSHSHLGDAMRLHESHSMLRRQASSHVLSSLRTVSFGVNPSRPGTGSRVTRRPSPSHDESANGRRAPIATGREHGKEQRTQARGDRPHPTPQGDLPRDKPTLLRPALTVKERPARELRRQARGRAQYSPYESDEDTDSEGSIARVHSKTHRNLNGRTLTSFVEEQQRVSRQEHVFAAADNAPLHVTPATLTVPKPAYNAPVLSPRETSGKLDVPTDRCPTPPPRCETAPPLPPSGPISPLTGCTPATETHVILTSVASTELQQARSDPPQAQVTSSGPVRVRQGKKEATNTGKPAGVRTPLALAVMGAGVLPPLTKASAPPTNLSRGHQRKVTHSRSPRPTRATGPRAGHTEQSRRVLPGTSEALQMRVDEYDRELRRCLRGGGGPSLTPVKLTKKGHPLLSESILFS